MRAKEEIIDLRRSETALKNELESRKGKNSNNYKEMYLEMREINKDLKNHFRIL